MPIKFLNNVAVDTNVLYVDTSSNRVGIGTSSPGQKLDVNGNIQLAQYGYIYFGSNSSNQLLLSNSLSGSQITQSGSGNLELQSASNDIHLKAGGSTKAVVRASGNVGIGTTGPTAKLEINGNLVFTNDTNSITFGGVVSSPSLQITNSSTLSTIRTANSSAVLKLDSYPGIEITTGGYDNVINSSGRWGIGTTNPNEKLHVNGGTTNVVANFESTDSKAFISFKDNTTTNTDTVFLGAEGNNMSFYAGSASAERIRIDSSGNVGINTTSPGQKLHVNGNVLVDGTAIFNTSTNTEPVCITRSGNTTREVLKIGVNDRVATFNYIEDTSNEGTGNFGSYDFILGGNSGETSVTPLKLEKTKTTIATFHQFESDGDFAIGDTAGINSGTSMHCDGSNIQVQSGAGGVYFQTGMNNYFSGSLCIGKTSPSAKLDVRGNVHIRHTSNSTTAFKVQGDDGDDATWFEITPNSSTVFVLGDEEQYYGGGFLKLNSSGKMLFLETEVGINTTSPTSGTKLDVNGAVKASEFYGQSMFINWRGYHSTTSVRTLYNTGMTSAFPYAYGVVGTLFKGCVSKVNVSNNPYSSYTSGPTGNSATLQVYKNGSLLQSVTSSYSNNAGEVVVFDFGQTATFNASDRLAFRFQANGLWRYVNVGILLKELI
tara:strand:- start:8264 stop:10234 length:1971 start_codon:yes stop_codon:yes gene_type:complete